MVLNASALAPLTRLGRALRLLSLDRVYFNTEADSSSRCLECKASCYMYKMTLCKRCLRGYYCDMSCCRAHQGRRQCIGYSADQQHQQRPRLALVRGVEAAAAPAAGETLQRILRACGGSLTSLRLRCVELGALGNAANTLSLLRGTLLHSLSPLALSCYLSPLPLALSLSLALL